MNYLQKIWSARYFWLHLARAELKYKFRRSKLGLLWTMINPLILSVIMAFIFSNLLKVSMRDFIPYVFSGLLVWEFLMGSVVGGCNSLIVSEAYIKQFKHPFAIYPLKTTLVNIASFLIAFLGLVLWIMVLWPMNLVIAVFAMPLAIISLLILGWPIAILTSFINLKYRDFAQIAALVMQAIWYMSPVFFQPKMFENANLATLLDYNPITHILNLVRAPMLYGQFPTLTDFGFVYGLAAIFYALAYLRIRSAEETLVFYF
jgi:lipopolysaccharide transport system permease protein